MNDETRAKSMPHRLRGWLRENWRDDTNVGKAKIAAIPVVIFILVALLWPASPPPPPPPPPPEQAELVPGIEDLRRQAHEAYESYETRIGALSEERRRELGEARLQVAEVYRDYERRIADLEQENVQLARQVEALENTLVTKEMELATAEVAATVPAESRAAELQEKLKQVRQELERLLESLP
jgi:DNA repair exonuclease SbcCD ATPase subunit